VKYIGIDVGLNGGIAESYKHQNYIRAYTIVRKMPLRNKKIDICKLHMFLMNKIKPCQGKLFIENIHGFPGMSVNAVSSLMFQKGVIMTLAEINGFDLIEINPATWKRHFGLIKKDKQASIDKAIELGMPAIEGKATKAQREGIAEAYLILLYGMAHC
jgi:hypothetical protein